MGEGFNGYCLKINVSPIRGRHIFLLRGFIENYKFSYIICCPSQSKACMYVSTSIHRCRNMNVWKLNFLVNWSLRAREHLPIIKGEKNHIIVHTYTWFMFKNLWSNIIKTLFPSKMCMYGLEKFVKDPFHITSLSGTE